MKPKNEVIKMDYTIFKTNTMEDFKDKQGDLI